MQKILLYHSIFICYLSSFAQNAEHATYTIECTTYFQDSCYISGYNIVKRSPANKKAFLKSTGYEKCPAGYEVDHIIPLCEGGTDCPDNMQLLTTAEHRKKTASEARKRSKKGNLNQ